MAKTPFRIVFMGTPSFAVPSLEALCRSPYRVVGVVTAPDRPQGRGRKPKPSPVKECARAQGLPILQPKNLRDPLFHEALRAWQPTLQVVVAFRVLPDLVWRLPPLGSVNLHASLLPRYRGAAPIHWAIINGEKKTGLTTFFIERTVDTGRILLQQSVSIAPDETTGTLYDKLMIRGARLVLKTVEALAAGDEVCEKGRPQSSAADLPKAPKITKQYAAVNWQLPAPELLRWIRGLHPTPGAFCVHRGTLYKLHGASLGPKKTVALPEGMWERKKNEALHIGCGANTCIAVERIQKEGTKPMSIRDFLRGLPDVRPRLQVVAALDAKLTLGKEGRLPWHLPDDLRRFKRLTYGHVVVMGRRSYASLPAPYRPLPGRINIILTRQAHAPPGCWAAKSLDEALDTAQRYCRGRVFVVGGGEIYAMALRHPALEALHLTEVHTETAGGTVFFPPIDRSDWVLAEDRPHPADATHAHSFSFRTYLKKERQASENI